MDGKSWALELALYNSWQHEKLYGVCDDLTDADRRQDRGMFFGSIHRTLDHSLMVDTLLLDYMISAKPPAQFDPNQTVHDDYAALRQARETFDNDLLTLLREKTDTWIAAPISFKSERLDRRRDMPRWLYLAQLVNHGTHHRSQVTAELHKLGIDYGNTDLPFNPHSQF